MRQGRRGKRSTIPVKRLSEKGNKSSGDCGTCGYMSVCVCPCHQALRKQNKKKVTKGSPKSKKITIKESRCKDGMNTSKRSRLKSPHDRLVEQS